MHTTRVARDRSSAKTPLRLLRPPAKPSISKTTPHRATAQAGPARHSADQGISQRRHSSPTACSGLLRASPSSLCPDITLRPRDELTNLHTSRAAAAYSVSWPIDLHRRLWLTCFLQAIKARRITQHQLSRPFNSVVFLQLRAQWRSFPQIVEEAGRP